MLTNSITRNIEPRDIKARQLAASMKLRRRGNLWLVPSQSSNDLYTVDITKDSPTCTCPDWQLRQNRCKHIRAIEIVLSCETKPDGTTIVTKTTRVTYSQDWPAYNAAQTHEGEHFPELLRGLCQGIVQPQQTNGRPRLPLSDVVFSAVLKVYSMMSGRRCMSDLSDCESKGYIAKAPHYNSTFHYLENPALTPILKKLIEESASPLKAVETDFAVDSSGFSTSRFERWFDAKYGTEKSQRQWLKAHLMVGVKTNVVTSVEVTESNANDSPHLPQLVNATANHFQIDEVSGDKGYISNKNLAAIVALGAVPYIPFKENTTGEGPELWSKLFHFYQFNRQEFLQHYHKRSNVETTFSMIKGKFGDSLRSKTDIAQMNEVLCKVLAHNICVLIASIYELGIEPTFWAESSVAQKVSLN